MASEVIQVELPTGDIIWARVPTDDTASNVSAGEVLQRLDIDELRSTVRGVSDSVRTALDDLVPDQLQVEFGLELSLKTGKITSMLAEAGATATLKVCITWYGDGSRTTSVVPTLATPPAA